MASIGHSPGSPSTTLYTTIHLSDSEEMGKTRRKRTIIGTDQLTKLEHLYVQEQWPNRERKEKLAKEIGMSTHFVNIWFQNKRSRMKKLAQEEAELAALRKQENGQVSMVSEEGKEGNEKINGMQSSSSSCSTSKASPGPTCRPIAPKSPATPTLVGKMKTEFLTKQKLSPHVVCVKLPLVAQSMSPLKTPTKVTLSLKTESESQQSSQTSTNTSLASTCSAAEARGPECCGTAKPCDTEKQQPQSPAAAQQMKIFAQQQSQQQAADLQTCQQQIHHSQQQHQTDPQKPAQFRFGTNPAVVLNKLPLTRHDVSQLNSRTEVSSEDMPSTSESTNPPSTYSLFDCLVAMAAVEEGGGIIQSDDANYDIAVNSTLYGIKVEEDTHEVVLTYDKKKGLRFTQSEADDVEI